MQSEMFRAYFKNVAMMATLSQQGCTVSPNISNQNFIKSSIYTDTQIHRHRKQRGHLVRMKGPEIFGKLFKMIILRFIKGDDFILQCI